MSTLYQAKKTEQGIEVTLLPPGKYKSVDWPKESFETNLGTIELVRRYSGNIDKYVEENYLYRLENEYYYGTTFVYSDYEMVETDEFIDEEQRIMFLKKCEVKSVLIAIE